MWRDHIPWDLGWRAEADSQPGDQNGLGMCGPRGDEWASLDRWTTGRKNSSSWENWLQDSARTKLQDP